MVRDIILDMKERDLLIVDKSDLATPVFDSIWGNLFEEDKQVESLICNIIIPEVYWSIVKYDGYELMCQFNSQYVPDTRNFRVRLVAIKNGSYHLFSGIHGDYGVSAYSYAISKNIAAPIMASMLPFIDIEGKFLVKIVKSVQSEMFDRAYIYSSKTTDLCINFSDYQASQLLSLCAPGNNYRYPTTGVGITKYLNVVIEHTDLQEVLKTQFEKENKPIQSAEFDNETGILDVICSPEKTIVDQNIENVSNLNIDFFNLFTDEYVRRNIVLDEVSDAEFISLLRQHGNVLNIYLIGSPYSDLTRVANHVSEGKFNAEGNILSNEDYYIVSSSLEAGTIIMFDDETEDGISDSPVFIINDHDETRLYTSLIEQPYWISENCHKCFILNKRSTVKYMISKTQYQAGKGLFVVDKSSDNMKNMLALTQDYNTGRLVGIVSNNTNISDMVLDEVTQRIYAAQL